MRLPQRPRLVVRARALSARLRADRVAALVALATACLGLAVVVVLLGWVGGRSQPPPTPVSVTALVADVRAGAVRVAWVDEARARVTADTTGRPGGTAGAGGTAGTGGAAGPAGTAGAVVAQVPAGYLPDVVDLLVERGVPVVATPAQEAPAGLPATAPGEAPAVPAGAQVVALLLAVLGLLALLAVSASVPRGAAPAGPRGVRSRLRVRAGRRGAAPAVPPSARLDDVAGAEEAVAELREMVAFLAEPERFTRTGARPPKGALLVGPPGTGKTLLARAVAGEAGVPFFAVAGSDFVEQYVGVGAKRVRELFAAAREHERAIVFIDEIDAVARRRDGEGGHAETENTLVALLAEMDGFTGSGVVVLAATNRPDVLDPAITRPGRLDRRVEVPHPDRRGRERILAVHAAGRPVADAVDLVALARRTPGFSGAQLSAVVNEACLEAVRADLAEVTPACFDAAVATVALGRARTSALVTEHDRRVTAWHEAGHTLAALLLPDADDPVSVTVVPRGPAGGVTWMSGSDDLFLPRRKAHAQLVVAMAGRAAEEVLLDGEYTQGAAGDLAGATDLAQRMVREYGMTRLGYAVRDARRAAGDGEVTDVVEELLRGAHATATRLLAGHAGLLRAVADALLDEETLSLAEVRALAAGCGVSAPVRVALPPPPDLAAPGAGVRAAGGPLVPVPAGGDRARREAAASRRRRRPAPLAAGLPAGLPVAGVSSAVTGGVSAVEVPAPGAGRR